MTLIQVLVIAVAFIVAGVAKGAIGMGMPPIAIGIMTFALPLEQSLAIMVLPTMATNIWQAIYGGGFARLSKRFWSMALTAVVGIFAIALPFDHLGSDRALAWVGVLLTIYSLAALTRWRPAVSRRSERWANPLVGILSGVLCGFTGVAAVPFLPYMQSLDMDRHDLVQALGIMFLYMIGALTLALVWQGAFRFDTTASGVAALVPTMIGMWLGQKGREAASPETFRKIFVFGMLALGLNMARGLL
jgi:uncharacterized membrane protein YfcA